MLIRNVNTGAEIEIDGSPEAKAQYRFKLACRGFDRVRVREGYALYFLTLTLRDEDSKLVNEGLNKFLNFLRARFRRAGLGFLYLWAVELQQKRYYRTGTAALHWHFAIGAPAGSLPACRYNKTARIGRRYEVLTEGEVVRSEDLYKGWGHGQVLCMLARSESKWAVLNYIGKYFEKDYASLKGYKWEWSKLRRFGVSRLGEYGYPSWALSAVTEADEEFGDLWRKRVGGRLQWLAEDDRGNDVVISEVRSPWAVVQEDGTVPERPIRPLPGRKYWSGGVTDALVVCGGDVDVDA